MEDECLEVLRDIFKSEQTSISTFFDIDSPIQLETFQVTPLTIGEGFDAIKAGPGRLNISE